MKIKRRDRRNSVPTVSQTAAGISRMQFARMVWHRVELGRRVQIVAALIMSVSLLIMSVSMAWYVPQQARKMSMFTATKDPPTLILGSGAGEDITMLNLGGIDVNETEGGEYQKRYVFRVEGRGVQSFYLELAHTTNLPFQYSIQWAKQVEAGGVGYQKKSQDIVYYQEYEINGSTMVPGSYINQDENAQVPLANDDYHEQTYGDIKDTKVQKHAQPLYWRSCKINLVEAPSSGVVSGDIYRIGYNEVNERSDSYSKDYSFRVYFILTVKWNHDIINENNKETDMIYLIASAKNLKPEEQNKG